METLTFVKETVYPCPLRDGHPAQDVQVWPEIQKALSLPIKAPSFLAKRRQPEGQGMDPPRRGGICAAGGPSFLKASR